MMKYTTGLSIVPIIAFALALCYAFPISIIFACILIYYTYNRLLKFFIFISSILLFIYVNISDRQFFKNLNLILDNRFSLYVIIDAKIEGILFYIRQNSASDILQYAVYPIIINSLFIYTIFIFPFLFKFLFIENSKLEKKRLPTPNKNVPSDATIHTKHAASVAQPSTPLELSNRPIAEDYSEPEKKIQPASQPSTPSAPPKLSVEEQPGTGPLLCDGTVCNSGRSCNDEARRFCQDVIKKVVPSDHFFGQFELDCPSGKQFLDFAIKAPDGKLFGIKLEGTGVCMTAKDHNEHALQHREIEDACFKVRRYQFNKNDLEKDMTDLVNWLDAHVKDMFFEATMGTGPLLCDGRVCDSGRSCNGAERWFCRDVIRKVVPSGHFTGQCKIKLPSRDRFFDFAIETREGKRINVEVDGYTYHAGPDVPEEKRGDDILREREAQDAGWTVRHYTFDAFKNDAEKCKRDLLSVMNERIDMSNKKFEEILSFNKTPVLKGRCPNQECDGQVCRKFHHGNKEFFWQCSKCKNPYNTNKYASFPHNAITPMSKWDDRYGIANSESTQKMTRAD